MKLILASQNRHKVKEFREMLEPLGYEVLCLKDIDFNDDIEETGNTFFENSMIKAKTIYDKIHLPVISDDSGISVDCLGGAPGVHSHRYAGENASDKDNRVKMIEEVRNKGLTKAPCHYSCVITYIDDERTIQTEGIFSGEVILEERGEHGFGYDSIVYLEEYGCTVAELTDEQKNTMSHRHKALEKLIEELKK